MLRCALAAVVAPVPPPHDWCCLPLVVGASASARPLLLRCGFDAISLPLRVAGLLVPVSEKYGDQRRIFDDLGAAVLTNANKGAQALSRRTVLLSPAFTALTLWDQVLTAAS